MNSHRIRIGDVVALLSGGSEMVVVETSRPGTATARSDVGVAWVDKRGNPKWASFPSRALQVIRSSRSGSATA